VKEESHTVLDDVVVAAQIKRRPREPWRVAARCEWGYPTVIWSPSLLADGTRFPNLAWLTCPYLVSTVSALESSGALREWTERIAQNAVIQQSLTSTDTQVRVARRVESGGEDACAQVGTAGQRSPIAMKCLHAHVALALSGVDDVVGTEVLSATGRICSDKRCEDLTGSSMEEGIE
jgi:hypothetical protein